jgi:hypothetical protein
MYSVLIILTITGIKASLHQFIGDSAWLALALYIFRKIRAKIFFFLVIVLATYQVRHKWQSQLVELP